MNTQLSYLKASETPPNPINYILYSRSETMVSHRIDVRVSVDYVLSIIIASTQIVNQEITNHNHL